jgi:hypothetical protein
MKLLKLILWPLLVLVPPALADTGYKQLFSKSKGIAVEDQIAIYRQLELKLAPDGQKFITNECDDPADYFVTAIDLNHDGTPEVFVSGGNNCTSGVTGSSLWLFVKSPSGYRGNFGFPGQVTRRLPEKSKGFPDLRLEAATGPCAEVYRWNGEKYAHLKDIETHPGGCKAHVQWGS